MRMSAEHYRRMAADYELMAERSTDQTLQTINWEFVRQWSGWAKEAEVEDRSVRNLSQPSFAAIASGPAGRSEENFSA